MNSRVDQDCGTGSGANHTGSVSRLLRAFIRGRGHVHPTRPVAAHVQGLVSAPGSWTHQRGDPVLPHFVGRTIYRLGHRIYFRRHGAAIHHSDLPLLLAG